MKPDEREGRSEETEGALIARAQARDQDAFRRLVELHRHAVHGLALRILRSPEDAEEVAQEAFVRAWRALPNFRGESRFSTWMHRIVARRSYDRLAVLKKRRAREVGVEEAETLPSGSADLGAEWQQMRRVEKLLDRLSDMQRAVVVLFYYEGKSVTDVALALGIPTGTVKTHLSRARATMRDAWARMERTAE